MLMGIRILLRIKAMQICVHWSSYPPRLHFESPGLHCERPRPSMALFRASRAPEFWLQCGSESGSRFVLKGWIRIPFRILLPKIMRIWILNPSFRKIAKELIFKYHNKKLSKNFENHRYLFKKYRYLKFLGLGKRYCIHFARPALQCRITGRLLISISWFCYRLDWSSYRRLKGTNFA